jgi:hypothetical protein
MDYFGSSFLDFFFNFLNNDTILINDSSIFLRYTRRGRALSLKNDDLTPYMAFIYIGY